MPELPEVEVVRSGLERHVVGRTVRSVEVIDARPLRRQDGGVGAFVSGWVPRSRAACPACCERPYSCKSLRISKGGINERKWNSHLFVVRQGRS